jgi:hypothetical protein
MTPSIQAFVIFVFSVVEPLPRFFDHKEHREHKFSLMKSIHSVVIDERIGTLGMGWPASMSATAVATRWPRRAMRRGEAFKHFIAGEHRREKSH